MTKLLNIFIASILLLSVASCYKPEKLKKGEYAQQIVDETKKPQLVNPEVVRKARQDQRRKDYNQLVEREYLKLSDWLSLKKSWTESTYFRRKSKFADTKLPVKALKNSDLLPEDPAKWKINDDVSLNSLKASRKELLEKLTKEVIYLMPNASAKALVYYDCWVEQTQNDYRTDQVNCKEAFYQVLDHITEAYKEIKGKDQFQIDKMYTYFDIDRDFVRYKDQDDNKYTGNYDEEIRKMVDEEKKQEEIRKKQAESQAASTGSFIVEETDGSSPDIVYTVYFDQKSSTISQTYAPELDKAVAEIKKINPKRVTINGHTDKSSGDAEEGLIISKQRADSVRDYLVKAGVSRDTIRTFGFGTSDPAVENADGQSEPRNRRVEVVFKGKQ
jgi:outer membrane protein OmpA-like peptidoglycan-associated protein